MRWSSFKLAAILTATLLLRVSSGFAQPGSNQQGFSQQPTVSQAGAPRPAQGNLTVSATVVTSVGLVIGPNGENTIIVANAPDPRDNVSRLQTMPTVAAGAHTDSPAPSHTSKKKKKRSLQASVLSH